MSKTQQRNKFQKELAKIKTTSLSECLKEVSAISKEFSDALEGIYCGKEGRIHQELCNGIFVTMGWYTVNTTPKVEYAYVSYFSLFTHNLYNKQNDDLPETNPSWNPN